MIKNIIHIYNELTANQPVKSKPKHLSFAKSVDDCVTMALRRLTMEDCRLGNDCM